MTKPMVFNMPLVVGVDKVGILCQNRLFSTVEMNFVCGLDLENDMFPKSLRFM